MAAVCIVCRLPANLREEVNALSHRGIPLRTIAATMADRGHPEIRKDAVHRHARHSDQRVSTSLDRVADSTALTLAVLVADVLTRWPSLASELADLLTREGLDDAADVVLATVPGGMRPALAVTRGTEAHELLEARALARAAGQVMGRSHPEVARELAAALRELGADDLVAAFSDLADEAERLQVVKGDSPVGTAPQTAPAGGFAAGAARRAPQTSARETTA